MSEGILFLILPERLVATVRREVDEIVVPDKRQSVQLFDDGVAATFSTDINEQTAENIIDRLKNYSKHRNNKLIIGHEVRCSSKRLTTWWKANDFGDLQIQSLRPKSIPRAVEEHCERTGTHWKSHALSQLGEFDGIKNTLDDWVRQFGHLGHPRIGRKIAASLRVIRPSTLPPQPFAMRTMDVIGNRQGYGYVMDDDPGGSWLEMQAILTHARRNETVFPIRWNEKENRLDFPDAQVDEFVIYEDGLWSGHELSRRLTALNNKRPNAPVIFRFGVVTDFGLMVARHAIRSLGLLGQVSIDSSASTLFSFLQPNIPDDLRLGLDLSRDSYFKELHQYVKPFAFGANNDWAPEEILVCKEIGKQLVNHWLSQNTNEPPTAEKVERFALGGGGFASTVVFSRSIPKVCLPFLWLDGKVTLQNRCVNNWKPLLVDSRRVADDGFLLS